MKDMDTVSTVKAAPPMISIYFSVEHMVEMVNSYPALTIPRPARSRSIEVHFQVEFLPTGLLEANGLT
jgi:hypothetical protein